MTRWTQRTSRKISPHQGNDEQMLSSQYLSPLMRKRKKPMTKAPTPTEMAK